MAHRYRVRPGCRSHWVSEPPSVSHGPRVAGSGLPPREGHRHTGFLCVRVWAHLASCSLPWGSLGGFFLPAGITSDTCSWHVVWPTPARSLAPFWVPSCHSPESPRPCKPQCDRVMGGDGPSTLRPQTHARLSQGPRFHTTLLTLGAAPIPTPPRTSPWPMEATGAPASGRSTPRVGPFKQSAGRCVLRSRGPAPLGNGAVTWVRRAE